MAASRLIPQLLANPCCSCAACRLIPAAAAIFAQGRPGGPRVDRRLVEELGCGRDLGLRRPNGVECLQWVTCSANQLARAISSTSSRWLTSTFSSVLLYARSGGRSSTWSWVSVGVNPTAR
jgi:hypothetical protein